MTIDNRALFKVAQMNEAVVNVYIVSACYYTIIDYSFVSCSSI